MKSLQEWLADTFPNQIEVKEEAITEHSVVAYFKEPVTELFKLFPWSGEENKFTSTLGIHWEQTKEVFVLKSHYYVGIWWLPTKEGEVYIKVAPKVRQNKRLNFLKVLEEILKDSEVSRFLTGYRGDSIFLIKENAPPIKLEAFDLPYIVFLIVSYLVTLDKLAKKGLKKDYLPVEKALKNRLRGKVLITKTFKRFHSRTDITSNICRFYLYSVDSLENRILKLALWKIKQFLLSPAGQFLNNTFLSTKLKELLHLFEPVSLVKISNRDFQRVKINPFYGEYRVALKLAYAILNWLGFEPFEAVTSKGTFFVYPYRINMPLLFELYVYSLLRKQEKDVLFQTEYTRRKLRPDFILPEKGIIADAKYKEGKTPDVEDLKQLSLYGRIQKLRNLFKREPTLVLIYPDFEGKNETSLLSGESMQNSHEREMLQDFHDMEIWRIPVPLEEVS